jgi:hypothetical protein
LKFKWVAKTFNRQAISGKCALKAIGRINVLGGSETRDIVFEHCYAERR